MTRTSFLTAAGVAVTMVVSATPAAAQRHGGGHSQGASHGVAVARSGPVAVPRTVVVSHGYGGYYYRPYYRPYYYHPYYSFVPRVSIGIGLWAGYPVAWSSYYYPYAYAYPAYSPYYYGYPPPAAYQYPAYPPAAYPPPSASGGYPAPQQYPQQQYPQQQYAQPNSVDVQPGSAPANSGGVSIEIEPATASVFIDGKYMGTGADFGPNTQPLGLTPGHHRVEIRAEGYQSLSFDADVRAGEVTPFKASLQRR